MRIPGSPEELTPEWSTAVFEARRIELTVEPVALERLEGLSSRIYRGSLAYAEGTGGGPPSVMVKLPLVRSPRRLAAIASG